MTIIKKDTVIEALAYVVKEANLVESLTHSCFSIGGISVEALATIVSSAEGKGEDYIFDCIYTHIEGREITLSKEEKRVLTHIIYARVADERENGDYSNREKLLNAYKKIKGA